MCDADESAVGIVEFTIIKTMSNGIILAEKNDKVDSELYLQCLAQDYEDLAWGVKEQVDLLEFLYCPESFVAPEDYKVWLDSNPVAIEKMKKITTESFHPPGEVLKAFRIAHQYISSSDEELMESGNEEVLADIESLVEALEEISTASDLEVCLVRG